MRCLTIEPFEKRNKQPRCNKNEKGSLTTSTLCEMVNSVMEKIKKKKVFNASIRDEMTGFRFELGEGSQQFFVLKTIYESLGRMEMLKSSIPTFIEIKLQMPPDTSKDLHKMQQHYCQQRWQTV